MYKKITKEQSIKKFIAQFQNTRDEYNAKLFNEWPQETRKAVLEIVKPGTDEIPLAMNFTTLDSFLLSTDLHIIIYQFGELKRMPWKNLSRRLNFLDARRENHPGIFVGFIGRDGSYIDYAIETLIENKFICSLDGI